MANEKLKTLFLIVIYTIMFELVLLFFNNTGPFIYEGF
jgi:hypothetical protein